MRGDGDGWVTCGLGHKHWGKHGAAGLLVRTSDQLVLMQLRVAWSHHGGTWGLLGGARDSHETVVETALREAGEEGGVHDAGLDIAGVYVDDHGGWSYSTVLAGVDVPFTAGPANAETDELRWVPEADLAGLPLHPHFARSWPVVREVPAAPVVVVDAANVVGSRPDGWWRDRLGAARRLRDRLGAMASARLTAAHLADVDARYDVPGNWHARFLMVVEGKASALAGEPSPPGVEVIRADGSGDDAIVALLTDRPAGDGRASIVVTADRALRARCAQVSPRTVPVGPRWLDTLPTTP